MLIVVKVLTADEVDAYGRSFTLDALQEMANKSGGEMWVHGRDLLTYKTFEKCDD